MLYIVISVQRSNAFGFLHIIANLSSPPGPWQLAAAMHLKRHQIANILSSHFRSEVSVTVEYVYKPNDLPEYIHHVTFAEIVNYIGVFEGTIPGTLKACHYHISTYLVFDTEKRRKNNHQANR